MTDATRSAADRAQRSPAFRIAARAGFAVNGLLNVVIGVIAIGIAVSSGSGGEASPNGALTGLADGPGGQLLIWVIAVGLLALGLWQIAAAVLEREPDRKKRAASRVKSVGKGIAYLAIAAIAVRIALGGSGGGSGEESFTATALSTPGGVVLIVVVGLGALGVGGYMVVKGVRQKFLDDLAALPSAARTPVTVIGTVGYVARGIAIGVIGILFIVAAVTSDASQAGGLDDALAALAALPFGKVVLVAIGIGFIAYGVYGGVRARYAKL